MAIALFRLLVAPPSRAISENASFPTVARADCLGTIENHVTSTHHESGPGQDWGRFCFSRRVDIGIRALLPYDGLAIESILSSQLRAPAKN